MADVSYIVTHLNGPPFNMKLMEHKFSDFRGLDLLQKLYDVFHHIMPETKRISVYNEADPASRLLEYLKAVKYKAQVDPITLRSALHQGDREVLYPLFKWVLSQLPVLQKRAMVGYYLTIPEIPNEFKGIPEIDQKVQEIRQLQDDFKMLHQSLEACKQEFTDPEQLKKNIQRRENDKHSLTNRIARAKDKAEPLSNYAELAPLCHELREAQQTLEELSAELMEEKEKRETFEREHNRSAAKLADLRATLSDGSGAAALERLRREAASLRDSVHSALPKAIEEKQKRLQSLLDVTDSGVENEQGLQRLRDTEARLQVDITKLREGNQAEKKRLVESKDMEYRRMQQVQEQCSKIARKKDDADAKVTRLQTKSQAVQREYEHKVAQSQASGVVKEDEWQAKYEGLKAILPQYKARKKEESELLGEIAVLEHTIKELKVEEDALMQEIDRKEGQSGAAGFVQTSIMLDKISEEKGAMDAEKGDLLDKISKTVTEINQKIKDKKAVLAPKIKQLRTLRQSIEDVEQQHSTAKQAYTEAKIGHESRLAALDDNVAQLQATVAEAETTYHSQWPMERLYSTLTHATMSPDESAALMRRMHDAVKAEESRAKELRENERARKTARSAGVDTADVLTGLQALLSAKLRLMEAGTGFELGGQSIKVEQYATGAGNVLTLG